MLGKYTVDQTCEEQGKDQYFKWLLNLLYDNNYEPEKRELFRTSLNARQYWTDKKRISRDEREYTIMYYAKKGQESSKLVQRSGGRKS